MATSNTVSKIIGNNVNELRTKVGLTLEGLTFALQISISYLMMIEKGTANISAKMAKNIAEFFDIDCESLYSRKEIRLKKIMDIPSVRTFYKENDNNPNFFLLRRAEYSVAYFLRTVLIHDMFMLVKHDAAEIRHYCKKKYNKDFGSQELSRELRRLYIKKVLDRDKKFDNGSVYEYWISKL
ncbi:helix-turn-helix domain-containing protein [Pedobacter nototheniae]|uniref:helix-turn-helix domain-containing protein n=1 Tax=Pedobacter nototheniae TaxID=2488994 RepID=UPI00103B77B0|nr:helix-turn-helix transcriptional regulator [Pedobacter nototheniae]